jgi:hypothetical protein
VRPASFKSFAVDLLFVILCGPPIARGQSVNLSTSSAHDQNIFDIYLPTADQVTQFQLESSKDWDFDQLSLTGSYSGALELFRDLPARNYHVHILSFGGVYHFENSGDADDSSGESDDTSSENGEAAPSKPPPSPLNGSSTVTAHSDSADRFLYVALTGGSQFDKDESTDFGNPSKYDNSVIDASAALRQPIGLRFSLRPSYTFSYHTYPNVSVVTNLQNIAGMQIGSDVLAGGWIAITPQFALKDYTGSSSFTDTVVFRNSGGHGKGFGKGNGGIQVRTLTFSTPSVRQFFLTLLWKQAVVPGTEVTSIYTRFGAPSGGARIIPQQLRGGAEERGIAGGFASGNEIFDDHFAYSGDAIAVQLSQSLPFGVLLRAQQIFQNKEYTLAAKDLADSLTISNRRDDRRYESGITISRPFAYGGGRILKPQLEFHHLRNDSNDPYYQFEKNIILFGIEFDF